VHFGRHTLNSPDRVCKMCHKSRLFAEYACKERSERLVLKHSRCFCLQLNVIRKYIYLRNANHIHCSFISSLYIIVSTKNNYLLSRVLQNFSVVPISSLLYLLISDSLSLISMYAYILAMIRAYVTSINIRGTHKEDGQRLPRVATSIFRRVTAFRIIAYARARRARARAHVTYCVTIA